MKEYLWNTLEDFYCDFLESEIYYHIFCDYQVVRGAEEKKKKYLEEKRRSNAVSGRVLTTKYKVEVSKESGNEGSVFSSPKLLESLLQDPLAMEMFTKFCKKEFSEENIEAWKAIEMYRSSTGDEAELKKHASFLYNYYFATGAEMETPVDARNKIQLKTLIEQNMISLSMFDTVQSVILDAIRSDSFPRFVRTPEYKEYARKKDEEEKHAEAVCCF